MVYKEILSKLSISSENIKYGIETTKYLKKQEKRKTVILWTLFILALLIFQYYFYDYPLNSICFLIAYLILRNRIINSYTSKITSYKNCLVEHCAINNSIALYCYYLDQKKPKQKWMYLFLIFILYQFNENGLANKVLLLYNSVESINIEYEPYFMCIKAFEAYLNNDIEEMEFLYKNIIYDKIDHKDEAKSTIDYIFKVLMSILKLNYQKEEFINTDQKIKMVDISLRFEIANYLKSIGDIEDAKKEYEYIIINGYEMPCVEHSYRFLEDIKQCRKRN